MTSWRLKWRHIIRHFFVGICRTWFASETVQTGRPIHWNYGGNLSQAQATYIQMNWFFTLQRYVCNTSFVLRNKSQSNRWKSRGKHKICGNLFESERFRWSWGGGGMQTQPRTFCPHMTSKISNKQGNVFSVFQAIPCLIVAEKSTLKATSTNSVYLLNQRTDLDQRGQCDFLIKDTQHKTLRLNLEESTTSTTLLWCLTRKYLCLRNCYIQCFLANDTHDNMWPVFWWKIEVRIPHFFSAQIYWMTMSVLLLDRILLGGSITWPSLTGRANHSQENNCPLLSIKIRHTVESVYTRQQRFT